MTRYTKQQYEYKLGRIPSTREDFKKLADELLDWAERETSLDLADFPVSKRFSPGKFYRWVSQSEYFADALDIARHMVGSRREREAHRGNLDSSIVLKTMALYNVEFRALFIEKLANWRESQENKSIMTVVVEQIPSSSMVPPKKI